MAFPICVDCRYKEAAKLAEDAYKTMQAASDMEKAPGEHEADLHRLEWLLTTNATPTYGL